MFACSRLTVSLCFIAVTFAGYIARFILSLSMLFYTIHILYYFASNGTNSNYTSFVGSAEYIKTEHNYIKFASSFSVVLKYFLTIIIQLMWCEKNYFRNLSHATITVSSVIAIHSLNELHTPCGVVSPQLGLLFYLFLFIFGKERTQVVCLGKNG